MKTPFKFGRKITEPLYFTNREDEVAQLNQMFCDGNNVILISPRRWGKSSLVEKAIQITQKTNPKIAFVELDLFTITSEKEFYELYSKKVLQAVSGKVEEWIDFGKKLLKNVIPTFSLGTDPLSQFEISFNYKEAENHTFEILNLAEEIARLKNIQIVVCIDEFQNLSELKNYESLEKKMRAVWQNHTHVSYCLYGSKKNMMEHIFTHTSKPFYKFGEIIMLPKIKEEKWVSFIQKNFKLTHKKIKKKEAEFIAQKMNNHSWYIQQYCYDVWNKTEMDVTDSILENSLQYLINSNEPFFLKTIENISKTQLQLLKAIVRKETQLTAKKVMEKYELGTPRNVLKNKQKLMDEDILIEHQKRLEFLDPLFEIWFQKVFYND